MPTWTWVLGGTPPAGVEQRELTGATGRSLTMRVDAACTAQFSLDGYNDQAALIDPLATDLSVYRDGTKLFRGRITTEDDTIGPNGHACQFTATDYRGMLAYRIIGAAGITYTATDQAVIAWDLIDTTQGLSGGNWGITDGVGNPSGTTRDRTYDPGKNLLDAISELGRVDGGFEWEIDPLLALNRYYPTRGTDNGVVLDFGGRLVGVHRMLQPGDFANSVLVTGSEGLTPADEVTAGIGTDDRGRWETFQGNPSWTTQATLDSKALWLLDQCSTQRPEISVTLTPGRWAGTGDVGLGDTVQLAIPRGRLVGKTAHRVVEINCTPGEDGTETITMGLVAA